MKIRNMCSSGVRSVAESLGKLDEHADFLGKTGEGDNEIRLWRMPWGVEVLVTNGDPVWEHEDGFSEVRETIRRISDRPAGWREIEAGKEVA